MLSNRPAHYFFARREKRAARPTSTATRTARYVAVLIAFLAIQPISTLASAATITVNPGQSIANGIASAAAGDTVLVNAGTYSGGINLNKSVNLLASGAVIVQSPSARNGTALSINCSDCSVTGFTFLEFGWAVDSGADWARVTLKNNVFRRSGTVWIRGSSWLVEGCEIDRPLVNGQPASGEDYMNMFGDGHILRRCYFHGLNLNTDLPAGAHNDSIQMFTEGGQSWQHLRNTIIEENIFCDFLEAIWISNRNLTPNGISNLTIRNNVFWGQDFVYGGSAVESSGCVMVSDNASGVVIQNNIMHHVWNSFSLYGLTNVTAVIQGNIQENTSNGYSLFEGTPDSAVIRGTKGNMFWNTQNFFLSPMSPDTNNVNPQLKNSNAIIGTDVVGPDGIPFTADDAWRPQNPAAATFGPQIAPTGGSTATVTAVNDSFSGILEDAAATLLNVLANDSVSPTATLSIGSVGATSAGGTAVISGSSISYKPAANFSGAETFTYTAREPGGATATATVTVNVTEVNDPPTANADSATVAANSAATTLNVLANDTALPDVGETLTITSVTTPNRGGTVTINAGTNLRYTPLASFSGTETFSYTISDGRGGTASATVTVTVTPPANNPPVAVNDSFSGILQGSSANVLNVLSNDSDPNGNPLTIISRTTPSAGGTVTISGSNLIYTPAPTFSGTETFSYTISDGAGGTATATVSVSVTAVNRPPVAVPDTFTGITGNALTTVTLNVLANDTDPDGNPITIVSVTQPSGGGTVTIGTGVLNYTPKSGFSGTETFTYTISDGRGGNATTSVSVTVVKPNTPPVAVSDSFSGILEDSSANVLNVLANDSDADGNPLTITSRTAPSAGGTVTITSGTLVYTPAPNFNGVETFSYTISDGNGGTASANVSVTVTPVNDPPVAVNDAITVQSNSSANAIPVLANDSDVDGDTLTITNISAASNGGTVSVSGAGLSYTPAANYVGAETFTYTISDGNGGSATATVTVTVADSNTPPVAVPDAFTIAMSSSANTISVCVNDYDPDAGDTFAVDSFGAPDHGGTLSTDTPKTLKYTPAAGYVGTETFTYTIKDSHGAKASTQVTITVKNTSPTANKDHFKVRRRNTTARTTDSYRLPVLRNDVSNSGTPLTLVGAVQDARAIHGLVDLQGNDLLYTPPADFTGSEVFLYTVRDANNQTATGEVTVEVTDQIGLDLCNDANAILVEMAGLYADFSLTGADLDSDGVPDDFMLEAMQVIACYDRTTSLGIASQTAYNVNLLALDSETNAPALANYREAIAAMMAMSTEMQGALNQVFDTAGLTLSKTYETVSCDENGTCMPQPIAGQALSKTYQTFDGARASVIVQPFAGLSDLDKDGLSNAQEYANVIKAGGSSNEFAAAVTDPKLDGTTLATIDPNAAGGSSGGGNGACFIATAAYGTPLASQINVLREIRDRDLLVNGLGAAFVDTYYRLSPPVARLVADHPAFASLVRVALWPIILAGKALLAAPALVLATFLAMIAAVTLGVRKRRQRA